MISTFDRLENIVGKGENAGYQHFLLFPLCFQKASLLELIVWWRVNGFGELSAIFIKFEIVVCKLFQFGRV